MRSDSLKSPLWRLLSLIRPYTGWMLLAVVLGVATIGSGIGLMSTSAYIIASAALHPSVAALEVAIVGVRFFGIARGVFRYLERYVSHSVTFRLLARLRVWFYEALEPLAPARLLRYRSGDLQARIVADIDTLQHFYVRVIAPPVVAVVIAAGMWLFMARYDLRLANALLAFLLLAGGALPLATHLLSRGPGRRVIELRAALSATMIDGVQGMAELVAFGQEARQQQRLAALDRELARAQRRMAWISGAHGALTTLLTNLALLAVLLIAIPLVVAGQMQGVFLAVLALAAMASFEAVIPLPETLQHYESSMEAARRLFEIVDATPAVQSPARPESLPATTTVVVNHLSFRYAPDEPLVLDDVSFTVQPGKVLAIVGPSGSGKTTLTHLLLRFWDAPPGSISLGGHDVRDLAPDDVRRCASVIAQQTYLFNATIRQNLLVAKPDASDDELDAAIRRAHLDDFIQTLPQGYETWVGEQGVRLSGGERQRLAIARALLRDAPVLILDEPTANLDAQTGREVMLALHEAMRGRATVLITHDTRDLALADEVLMLREGRVTERRAAASAYAAAALA